MLQRWDALGDHDPAAFVGHMNGLADELPADRPEGHFEVASAHDSTGHSDGAVPLYRRALALGLQGERRRRAVIQLASSLRNLGQPRRASSCCRASGSWVRTPSTTL